MDNNIDPTLMECQNKIIELYELLVSKSILTVSDVKKDYKDFQNKVEVLNGSKHIHYL